MSNIEIQLSDETHTCPECKITCSMKITRYPVGCHGFFIYALCKCGHEYIVREGQRYGGYR